MILIRINNNFVLPYQQLIFGGGENHVRIESAATIKQALEISLTLVFKQDKDIIELLQITDAIRRINPSIKIFLRLPYFPGARQDRVCYPGEPLSVKVYADLINSQNYAGVEIYDPHSDVTPALLNNVKIMNNHGLVESALHMVLKGKKQALLVSPDAGSNKKIFDLAKSLNIFFELDVVRADKKRDTKTGKVVATEVFADDLKGQDCFIVDDICSKGGTFMALAMELKKKNAGDIYLIVSHYEGSATEQNLKDSGIKRVFMGVNLQKVPTGEFLYDFNIYA
jgi:ribose-phosphate pyrophosphokinase